MNFTRERLKCLLHQLQRVLRKSDAVTASLFEFVLCLQTLVFDKENCDTKVHFWFTHTGVCLACFVSCLEFCLNHDSNFEVGIQQFSEEKRVSKAELLNQFLSGVSTETCAVSGCRLFCVCCFVLDKRTLSRKCFKQTCPTNMVGSRPNVVTQKGAASVYW